VTVRKTNLLHFGHSVVFGIAGSKKESRPCKDEKDSDDKSLCESMVHKTLLY
jgi:hypothetical protein